MEYNVVPVEKKLIIIKKNHTKANRSWHLAIEGLHSHMEGEN